MGQGRCANSISGFFYGNVRCGTAAGVVRDTSKGEIAGKGF
ncbi:hypothetical protein OROGR_000788 [Orobanche gracilis]